MNGDGSPRERIAAQEATPEGDLSRRLERLGAELDGKRMSASSRERPASERASADGAALGNAFRLSAEFVAGVVAGGIVGWLIDRLVGSSPWGLIVCLILGFCAGMLNLMRAAGLATPKRMASKE